MSEEARHTLSPTSKFTIALGSGIIAGFAAAVLSHVSFISFTNSVADIFTACRYPSISNQ
jgi:hypothetical protein